MESIRRIRAGLRSFSLYPKLQSSIGLVFLGGVGFTIGLVLIANVISLFVVQKQTDVPDLAGGITLLLAGLLVEEHLKPKEGVDTASRSDV